MRIIKLKVLVDFWATHPDAKPGLQRWFRIAKAAEWRNLRDVKKTFPHADAIEVASGRKATVFNIAGNKYRLIAAIHYKSQIIYTLLVLTHAEYSADKWKEVL